MTDTPDTTDTASPPQPGAPRRRSWFRRHKVLTALGGIVVLIVVLVVTTSGGGDDGTPTAAATAAPPASDATDTAVVGGAAPSATPTQRTKVAGIAGADDVTVSGCTKSDNPYLGPTAQLTVTNHSSKASNYSITVTFTSPDGATQLDSGNAFVQSLAPGQTTQVEATGLKEDAAAGQFTCKLARVDRFAA